MKQYLLPMPLLLLFAALAVDASAARQTPTTGRVVDPDGTAVAYATVVLLDAETQLAGTATAADGSFSLKVPAGRYRLTIQYLGYETLTRDVDTPGDLGEFVLHPASVEMQEVVVKTSLVRREADRFVMEIAGSPVALGKDGTELLKQAPGVWLTDDKIAINGASGVKVYINDREVRMSTEQLLNYLRGLKSEEIQRIEVIRRPVPTTTPTRRPASFASRSAASATTGSRATFRSRRARAGRSKATTPRSRSTATQDAGPSMLRAGRASCRCMSRKPPNTPNTVRAAHCSTPPPKCGAATTAAADAPARSSTSPNGTASAPRPTSTSTATARPTARRPTSAKRSG